jgi:hypothetical protein
MSYLEPRVQKWFYENSTSGVLDNRTSNSSRILDFPSSVTRVSNPKWRKLVSVGSEAGNPYANSGMVYTPCTVHSQSEYRAGSYWERATYYSENPGIYPALPVFNTDARDKCLQRFKSKLATQANYYNAVIPLSQMNDLRKTIEGSLKITLALFNDIGKLRKGKISQVSLPKMWNEVWLTYGFGIAPTLSDIADITTAIIASLNKKRYARFTAGSSVQTRDSYTELTEGDALGGFPFWSDLNVTYRYSLTGGFPLDVKNDSVLELKDFGFQWGTFIPAAWELVPFTWVFDYFGTIGAVLEDSFTAPSGVLGYLDETLKITYEGRCGYRRGSSPWLKSFASTDGNIKGFLFTRGVLTALPHRELRVRTFREISRFDVNGTDYGLSKLINLAAVAYGSLKSHNLK